MSSYTFESARLFIDCVSEKMSNKLVTKPWGKGGFVFCCFLEKFHDFITSKMYLTLSQTIPNFNDLEREDFKKHCGKGRKCW